MAAKTKTKKTARHTFTLDTEELGVSKSLLDGNHIAMIIYRINVSKWI